MSPTTRLLVVGLVISFLVAFSFGMFALSGGFVHSARLRQVRLSDVLYDQLPVAATPRPEGPPPSAGPRPPAAWEAPETREPGVPETAAEELYYAAVRKARERTERMARRTSGREAILRYLEAGPGQGLKLASDLARRGRLTEAKAMLVRLLPGLSEADWRVQAYVLKMAIHLYKQDRDAAGLRQWLDRYLGMARAHLGSRQGEAQERGNLRESQAELEALVGQVERLRSGDTAVGR